MVFGLIVTIKFIKFQFFNTLIVNKLTYQVSLKIHLLSLLILLILIKKESLIIIIIVCYQYNKPFRSTVLNF